MQVEFNADQQRWRLNWLAACAEFQLKDGLLVNTDFRPAQSMDGSTQQSTLLSPFTDNLWLTRLAATVQLAPGDRPVRWAYHSWTRPDAETLMIVLQAENAPLQSELCYTADEATGLLRCETTLRHTGGPALDLSHAGSFSVLLPAEIEKVTYLSGHWGAETQVQQTPLGRAPLLLESRAGKTGFEVAPYLALHTAQVIYLCQLLWSGNWQLHAYRLVGGQVVLSGGLNAWGFRHRLKAQESLTLPAVLLGCVTGDLNAATQRLHDYRRRQRPNPERPLPVHFNSWYPYQGEPRVAKMQEFAAAAADLGCEIFVLDAGWYTTEVENPNETWWPRTGDWIVNRRNFPNGLEELSRTCQVHGIGFGIWFEPEAIGASAQVRREHSEWLHWVGGEEPAADQRAILHLGVPEARAFIRERILRILRATNAVWLKWDFNTDLRQGGWASSLPTDLTDQDPLVAHYRGLYQLQDELRAALPDLVLEMCSSGGGRFDGAVMSHAHTFWISDQTQALMNLSIHFGSQLAHPAIECNDWLIEWPPHSGVGERQPVDLRGDLAFRTRVAMLGTFGVSAPVDKWSVDELALMRQHVAWYKANVRPIIHTGDQYFLTEAPPLDGNGDWAAVWYVTKDGTRGHLFAFRLASADAERTFALPGLDATARYRLISPEGEQWEQSGATLAKGLSVTAAAPFRAVLWAVERI
ncbi:MAG: alpha-galactosidase [Caldilineaceae bacterium]